MNDTRRWARWMGPLAILAAWSGSVASLEAQEVNTENADATIEAAQTVALDWVALLDTGEFAESWHQAAAAFQDAVTPEQWETAVNQARAAVGTPGERERASVQQLTDPPNSPPGEYVVLQFRTTATEGADSIETVVLVKRGDDWKVTGYFVKPA